MAFIFPGCDPAMLIAYLANLSEDEQAEFMENASDDEDEFNEHTQSLSTQERMVQRFKAMREKFVRSGGILGEQMLTGNLSASCLSMDDAKPKSETRSLAELKPMIGKELELGTTYRGRFLCGWVAIDAPFFGIASSSLLLEDVTGYLVEIAAYGLVNTELPPRERQRVLASKFPTRRPIVVLEPYYKVRLDGSEGIRVEEAEGIIPWLDVPTDLMSWKKLGNEYFSVLNDQNEGRGALACYQRAVENVQSEVHTLVMLLNNIATCHFKMEDYKTSIQLSGAAVHLDKTYFKGWYRLASALAEYEAKGDEGCSDLLAARVVARACSVLTSLSPKEIQVLESTLKCEASPHDTTKRLPFSSYAEWCMVLAEPGLTLILDCEFSEETKTADEWRKEGSVYFVKGDIESAEENYRKGLAIAASCCQNVSVLLNNIAAVHLSLCRGSDGAHGEQFAYSDSIPSIEAANLNCTVAGIIDPLNHKAWLRRARCLENMGLTHEKCDHDLQRIREDVVLNAGESDRLKDFKRNVDADIQQRLKTSVKPRTARMDPKGLAGERQDRRKGGSVSSKASTEEDLPSDMPSVEDYETIDQNIARLEGIVSRMRMAYEISKSESDPRLQLLPQKMLMFFTNPPPELHIEFPKLREWPKGIDSTYARKFLYRAYLDAGVNPWISAHNMRE